MFVMTKPKPTKNKTNEIKIAGLFPVEANSLVAAL